jgi:hypothetical protein
VIKRRQVLGQLAVAALAVTGTSVQAQNFPAKPLRIVVPYAAGGSPDTVARILAQQLGSELGQSVVVENIPGSSGIAAIEIVRNGVALYIEPEKVRLKAGDRVILACRPQGIAATRGVAGIDGCTSTALGAAYCSNRLTTLISGDIAFFYDSNALWNNLDKSHLKIIVINNGGGGIFGI